MNLEIPEAIDGRTRRRIENGARIFDAAMELLTERSYDEISVKEICAVANVGRATFFRVYQTKADLLLEFNRRLASRVQERLDANDPQSVDEALRIVGEEIADTWTHAVPGAANLAIDFARTGTGGGPHAAHPELLQIVVRFVEAGLASGELESILPPQLMGSLALVQIAAPVPYWFKHPKLDLHELINDAVDHWLNGVIAKKGRRQ